MYRMQQRKNSATKLRVGAYLCRSANAHMIPSGTLENQQIAITEYLESCHGQNCESVQFYIEEQVNPGQFVRPTLEQLRSDIADWKINAVVCTELSRIARSIVDVANVWEYLNWCDVDFISLRENLDSSTPMGRSMLEIIVTMADLERRLEQ